VNSRVSEVYNLLEVPSSLNVEVPCNLHCLKEELRYLTAIEDHNSEDHFHIYNSKYRKEQPSSEQLILEIKLRGMKM
jgi:hypothetical protein